MYKIVAIDCDGTLLNSQKEITNLNESIIKKLVSMNVKIILATARPFYRIKKYLEQLNLILPGQYSLCFNGAMLIDNYTSQEIFSVCFSKENILQLLAFSKQINKNVFLYTKDSILSNHKNEEYVAKNKGVNFIVVDDLSLIDFEKYKVYKYVFVNSPKNILKIKGKVFDALNTLYEVSSSVPQFIEVVPKGITKSRSLLSLTNKMNVSMIDVIAFGDEDNDIDMLQSAGLSVAVGNASENVKKIADIITLCNDESGVGVELKKIFNL